MMDARERQILDTLWSEYQRSNGFRLTTMPPLLQRDGRCVYLPASALPSNSFWFEITAVATATTSPTTGQVDADQKAYSWKDRIQVAPGVWAYGDRSGTANAFLAEPSAGDSQAVAVGTLCLAWPSITASDTYEFRPWVSGGSSTDTSFYAIITGYDATNKVASWRKVNYVPNAAVPGKWITTSTTGTNNAVEIRQRVPFVVSDPGGSTYLTLTANEIVWMRPTAWGTDLAANVIAWTYTINQRANLDRMGLVCDEGQQWRGDKSVKAKVISTNDESNPIGTVDLDGIDVGVLEKSYLQLKKTLLVTTDYSLAELNADDGIVGGQGARPVMRLEYTTTDQPAPWTPGPYPYTAGGVVHAVNGEFNYDGTNPIYVGGFEITGSSSMDYGGTPLINGAAGFVGVHTALFGLFANDLSSTEFPLLFADNSAASQLAGAAQTLVMWANFELSTLRRDGTEVSPPADVSTTTDGSSSTPYIRCVDPAAAGGAGASCYLPGISENLPSIKRPIFRKGFYVGNVDDTGLQAALDDLSARIAALEGA